MKSETEILWLQNPEDHNYPAALSYLSLLYNKETAKKYVADLQAAGVSIFKAKDIFRASSLSLPGVSNSHVEKDISKIKNGAKPSPLL